MSWKLANAIAEKQIGDGKLLAIILALHCFQDSRSCHPSICRLAALCETSERHVFRTIGKLKDCGFLTSEGKGGRGKRTTYTLHPDALANVFAPENPDAGVILSDENPDAHVTKTLTPTSLNPDVQVSRNKEEKVLKRLEARGSNARFVPPTLDEVSRYCRERGNNVDPEHFIDFYTVRAWKVSGGLPVKDWKACVRTWEKNGKNNYGHGERKQKLSQQEILERETRIAKTYRA